MQRVFLYRFRSEMCIFTTPEAGQVLEKVQTFDICIVGGGMVGMTLVQLLANEFPQTRLCLVEQHAISTSEDLYQPGFDGRSTALSIGSAEVFSALGLWSEMFTRATEIN